MQLKRIGHFRERTAFIGRVDEKQLLFQELDRGAGLVTITGPSGIGKTRLARSVGSELASSLQGKGEVFFCSLSSCEDAHDAEAAVARALRILDWEGGELEAQLVQRRRTLLILDNVDGIARDFGPILERWLDGCFNLQVLSTSILPLELEGEIRLELGPLAAADAVDLYLERAKAASSSTPIPPSDLPLVEELVCRLDRYPLAIELAAARVRLLPPAVLLRRLGDRLAVLRSNTPGRHGSLYEALSLTWGLLSEQERTLLARASIFEGGFTADAALAVLGPDLGEEVMLSLLDGLCGKALLEVGGSEQRRFSLLECIQAFAKEQGGEDLDPWIRRHARYYVEIGEEVGARLHEKRAVEAIRWLKTERANLTAALRGGGGVEPSLAARAGILLARLMEVEGFPRSERDDLDETLRLARLSAEPGLLGAALLHHAEELASRAQIAEAKAELDEAMRCARQIGDRRLEGLGLIAFATTLSIQGRPGLAISTLRQAAEVGREAGLASLEARAWMGMVTTHVANRDLGEAQPLFEQIEQLPRLAPARDSIQYARLSLHALGWIRMVQGRFREARAALLEALELARTVGSRSDEARQLRNLAVVETDAGRLDEAEGYALEALTIERETGRVRDEGTLLAALGMIALRRRDWGRALEHLTRSVGLQEHAGDKFRRAKGLLFLPVAEARAGRLFEAEKSLEAARAYFNEIGADVDAQMLLVIADLVEGNLEMARARQLGGEEASRLVASARERLLAGEGQDGASVIYDAIRLLADDLEDWDNGQASTAAAQEDGPLEVGAEGAWFQREGERVDLGHRPTLRGILQALVEARLERPGKGEAPQDLFSAGWPGVTIDAIAAMRRVYIGIWTLRSLGLADVLLNQGDGYYLDPKIPLRQVPAPLPAWERPIGAEHGAAPS